MSVTVIGIDGLDYALLRDRLDRLPGFRALAERGILRPIDTVFPADSVPAWLSIFTGLTPAEHGIVRGKDYVESVADYEKTQTFRLAGRTFWDEASRRGRTCLVLNPFLAYPAWPIRGEMISGPAFVAGPLTATPAGAASAVPQVYGGYAAVGAGAETAQALRTAVADTEALWDEFRRKRAQAPYDLAFVTFTTLDRIQHYSWRFFDPGDPLHEHDDYLSRLIPDTLAFFDRCVQEILAGMGPRDALVVVSDHGFRQRPFRLVNLNDLLRQAGLLVLRPGAQTSSVRFKQRLKRRVVQILSVLRLLDMVLPRLRNWRGADKYKKSDFLIDRGESVCFVDALFSGKKPYVGLTFGDRMRQQPEDRRRAAIAQVADAFRRNPDLPQPLWIKPGSEVYAGSYADRLPDVCLELPAEFGVEFDLFAPLIVNSATHYRLSGGHYGASTFGCFRPERPVPRIDSVLQVGATILDLLAEP